MIHTGDCLQILPTFHGLSFDAVVTDPPYGIGFMGKEWDHGVPGVRFWRSILRVAKPGAHLLAFGGTRTYHRLACAIEDAGWEIRDCLMWVYGSGFPKSRDASKALDAAAGAERKVIGTRKLTGTARKLSGGSGHGCTVSGNALPRHDQDGQPRQYLETLQQITEPATAEAKKWDGWGTALKPAWEPIILARKPLAGTIAENLLAYGTGALNIDGCRLGEAGGGARDPGRQAHFSSRAGELSADRRYTQSGGTNFAATPGPRGGDVRGRWPANLVQDGSAEVAEGLPPAARRFFYCAKASRRDRNEGLDSAPDAVLARSCQAQADAGRGNTIDAGAGAFNKARVTKNNHPTVKPTALMRYLVRLVTPQGGMILDPFAGSGSTGKAAALEGFEFAGIEINPDYARIAERRIAVAKATEGQAHG